MSIDTQIIPKTSHILGIDFGKAKVGLALADGETKMAFAYSTITNDKNLLQNIAEIVEKEHVKKIIIGVPAYFNTKNVEYEGETFGKLIQKVIDIPVFYQNEMFTTKMAQANLIEKKVKGVKNYDDEEAARIILQEWLDRSELC